MAGVSFKNVSKIYPAKKRREIAALHDLDLEISDRELVVLVGPAGSGKSTLLRLIAGLEKISTGDILIGDKRVNDLAPKDRDVAMVFQNDALYPQMSVLQNLAFGLKLRKYSKAEIKGRVEDAAGILGLGALLDRKPSALSADQRRRVAIARAIARQPKVLLFDEPLADLEGTTRRQLRMEFIKLQQRLQTTTICATRDSIEAMSMGDRLVVLKGGVVQQSGAPAALYSEPANLFVAGFLGRPPMNLIKGMLKADGDQIRFCESEGGTVEVIFPAGVRPAAREFIGKSVILGVRPEDLAATTLRDQDSRSAVGVFPAIVDLVEPLGAETNLYLETGAHTLVGRSREALDHREAGHRFQFGIDVSKAHLFDPVSGRRIA